jgi:signal peptidase II
MKRWFIIAAAIIAVDQATKWLIAGIFCCRPPLAVTPFFNLVLAHNTGAAFSFLAGEPGWQRWFFSAIAVIAAVTISVLIQRHTAQLLFCAGLALILGGALGNLIDRVFYGYVIDFLDFYAAGWHFPAFNVADSAITVGAGLLILDGFRQRKI